jgi:hypothetical protein
MCKKFLLEKVKGWNYQVERDVDWKAVMDVKELGCEDMYWIHLAQYVYH